MGPRLHLLRFLRLLTAVNKRKNNKENTHHRFGALFYISIPHKTLAHSPIKNAASVTTTQIINISVKCGQNRSPESFDFT